MQIPRTPKPAPMGPDAFAGFLKLWLTPASRLPADSAEVQAYLRHASRREPLSAESRRAIGKGDEQRAA